MALKIWTSEWRGHSWQEWEELEKHSRVLKAEPHHDAVVCPHTDAMLHLDCQMGCHISRYVAAYEGRVLATRERNYSNDSDFYAVVWDGERLRYIEYDTTRCASTGNSALVDATEATRAAATAWLQAWLLERAIEVDAVKAQGIEAGRVVEVYKGRKYPKGMVGTVERVQEGQWGLSALVDFKTSRVWIAVQNLRVVQPANYQTSRDEMERRAAAIDCRGKWHLPFTPGMVVL